MEKAADLYAHSNNGAGCKFESHHLAELNRNFATLNKQVAEKDQWVKDYIDRTMPIKSHFWILLGSLSVLASFAAAIRYIDRLAL